MKALSILSLAIAALFTLSGCETEHAVSTTTTTTEETTVHQPAVGVTQSRTVRTY